MKHARKDYAHIQDPSGHIPADEPVFLLRGQDALAPELLLRYASKYRLATGTDELPKLVEAHAMSMFEWQRGKHDGEKHIKMADLPLDYADRSEEVAPVHIAVLDMLDVLKYIASKQNEPPTEVIDTVRSMIIGNLYENGIEVAIFEDGSMNWKRRG